MPMPISLLRQYCPAEYVRIKQSKKACRWFSFSSLIKLSPLFFYIAKAQPTSILQLFLDIANKLEMEYPITPTHILFKINYIFLE